MIFIHLAILRVLFRFKPGGKLEFHHFKNMKYFYPLKCSKNCLDSSSLAEKISTFFKRLFLNNSMFSTCNAGNNFDNFLFLTAQRKPCRADFSPGISFSISFLSHFLPFSLSQISFILFPLLKVAIVIV